MKSEWQIVESPHSEGPLKAIRRSRFRVGELIQRCDAMPFRATWSIDATPLTDLTYLVVVTFKK